MSTSWKQALFLGGAVMILAACSDATGPRAPMNARTLVSVRQTESLQSQRKTKSGDTATPRPNDCRSGYSVSVGVRDTTLLAVCAF